AASQLLEWEGDLVGDVVRAPEERRQVLVLCEQERGARDVPGVDGVYDGTAAGQPQRAIAVGRERGDDERGGQTAALPGTVSQGGAEDYQLEAARAPPEKRLPLHRPARDAVGIHRPFRIAFLAGEVARPAVNGATREEQPRRAGGERGGRGGRRR